MKFPGLYHRTTFIQRSLLSKCLPYTPDLQKFDPKGTFHLVDDPLKSKQTTIIGMFVLRPAKNRCTSKTMDCLYGDYDWAFNIKGLDGGRLISNNNTLDAYRLAFQYGLSDAVMIGSNIVSTEGVDTSQGRGYLWQPYEVCKWPHLLSIDADLNAKLGKQRTVWQELGYLSKRKYPAQIVFTWSGERKEYANDFLAGRVFHDILPDGERVESYIMTSQLGAHNIRARAAEFGLQDRIEDMLIIIPPPANIASIGDDMSSPSGELDLSVVPKLLFEQYDMNIANHDGGQGVLLAFARAGVLSQLNLTLCKQKSVVDVLHDCDIYDEETIAASHFKDPLLFEPKVQYFFRNVTPTKATSLAPYDLDRYAKDIITNVVPTTGDFVHSLPRNLQIASVIEDAVGEVEIVTLKTNFKFDFCVE